jgi:squalene-hopene/tetraprenyl-beta-curcumene cyclase
LPDRFPFLIFNLSLVAARSSMANGKCKWQMKFMTALAKKSSPVKEPLIVRERLAAAYSKARSCLLSQQTHDGVWTGELASSSLATATAVSALALVDRERYSALISGGVGWLLEHQNRDGGWGDTVRSFSNISTTMLCRAALTLGRNESSDQIAESLRHAEHYLEGIAGGCEPETLARAVRERYGKDRTFSVPILSCCALAGLIEWKEAPPLPFELACLPSSAYKWINLPVVSYALPALIALGIVQFSKREPRNPLLRALRRSTVPGALRKLESIQPVNGGFLEATPLVSFVAMSLAGAGRAAHPVVEKGIDFLLKSVRPDGSWPIDTNLSTWVTTLSLNALSDAGETLDNFAGPVRQWLLDQQYRTVHPFTSAAPGGWGWAPLPGAVPDADDTAGTLIALRNLGVTAESVAAATAGLEWLLALQNGDGGWPTFCRGWGYLPFDRSSADITAHALRALHSWNDVGREAGNLRNLRKRLRRASRLGLRFLKGIQRADGSWLPLWFGNQHSPDDENPVYGTARVLAAYRDLNLRDGDAARRGYRWLIACQGDDGGWGGSPGVPTSVEETALAVDALIGCGGVAGGDEALARGIRWLVERVENGSFLNPSPIGFYFAKLWYFEKLYPLIFTAGALGRARKDLRFEI